MAQTNGYLVDAPEGALLVDAPEGICDWLRSEGVRVGTLLLTHTHYDHVLDASKLRKEHECEVIACQAPTPDTTLAAFMAEMGMPSVIEPFEVDAELGEDARELTRLGLTMGVRHVPGHSPDSLCYVVDNGGEGATTVVFGGDVLFQGSIGRTDFPHGNHDLLIRGIREKLFALDDAAVVYPGHGPVTTIGEERRSNPYVGD